MKDDVSAIPTSGCNVLTNTGSISNYNGNTRRDYVFNGGKWYLYRSQSYQYSPDISAYSCIDVSTLSSNAELEPLIMFIPNLLVIFTILAVFWVIKGLIYGFAKK
jgi:hypothetical protein